MTGRDSRRRCARPCCSGAFARIRRRQDPDSGWRSFAIWPTSTADRLRWSAHPWAASARGCDCRRVESRTSGSSDVEIPEKLPSADRNATPKTRKHEEDHQIIVLGLPRFRGQVNAVSEVLDVCEAIKEGDVIEETWKWGSFVLERRSYIRPEGHRAGDGSPPIPSWLKRWATLSVRRFSPWLEQPIRGPAE